MNTHPSKTQMGKDMKNQTESSTAQMWKQPHAAQKANLGRSPITQNMRGGIVNS